MDIGSVVKCSRKGIRCQSWGLPNVRNIGCLSDISTDCR